MARPANPRVRESLLKAAREIFARKGIGGASVAEITKLAGVSKGAFYLHFKSKDEVFGELLTRFLGVIDEVNRRWHELDAALQEEWGPLTRRDVLEGTARLEACRKADRESELQMLEAMWLNRDLLAILESAPAPQYHRVVESFEERIAQELARELALAKKLGSFQRDLDEQAVGDIIVGAHDRLMRRMTYLRQKPDLSRWARTLSRVLYDGMLEKPPESGRPARRRPPRRTRVKGR